MDSSLKVQTTSHAIMLQPCRAVSLEPTTHPRIVYKWWVGLYILPYISAAGEESVNFTNTSKLDFTQVEFRLKIDDNFWRNSELLIKLILIATALAATQPVAIVIRPHARDNGSG